MCDNYLFSVMYIHARLRRLATNLEALQGPPVGVITVVGDNRTDTRQRTAQVEDVRLPRRADVGIADVHLRVVDVDDLAVETGAQGHGLSGSGLRRH